MRKCGHNINRVRISTLEKGGGGNEKGHSWFIVDFNGRFSY